MANEQRTLDRLMPPGLRRVEPLKWPGSDEEVGLMMLTCEELQDATVAAREVLRKRSVDLGLAINAEMLQAEEETQIVFRAVLERGATDPSARVFKSADEVRKRLDPDQRNYFNAWHLQRQTEALEGVTFPDDDEG